MSNVQIFSVYDSKAEAFQRPFFMPTRGSAIRAFSEAVGDEKTDFCKFKADFTLFHIGEFDEIHGTIKPLEAKVSLGTALELSTAKV